MKTRIFPVLFVGFFLIIVAARSVAAPAPEAGRPKEIASLQAHRLPVQALAFRPDGKMLVSGDREGTIKLWAMPGAKNLDTIQAYRSLGGVFGVAFSPDGKTFASCDGNGEVKLWNAATGTNTATLDAKLLVPLLFSPDGKTLVSSYELFDLEKKKSRKIVDKPGSWPVASFDAKGKLRVGASFTHSDTSSFVVWDAESGKKILTYKGKRRVVQFAAFSPDSKTAVSSEGDYDTRHWVIRLWDIASGKNTVTIEQSEVPSAMIFSPDGKIVAASCSPAADREYPGIIRLFEAASGKVLATLKRHKRPIGRCLAFSPDGRFLASGSIDGVLKIWSLPARYKAE